MMTSWNRDVGDIIAEIKMMMASSSSYFWIVEGPSDQRFFSSRVRECIELIVAGGKINVLGALDKLAADPIVGQVLGIVDSDVDWLIPVANRPDNLISTDPRDVEGILLRSSALKKVLAEYGDLKKVAAFEREAGVSVVKYIHDVASLFGRIRAVNDIYKRTSMKKFKPQAVLTPGTWTYDYDRALDLAVRMGVSASVSELKLELQGLPVAGEWHYARGHDAVNILTGGLLTIIGRGVALDDSRVEAVLRAGIEDYEYQESNLYMLTSEWCREKGI